MFRRVARLAMVPAAAIAVTLLFGATEARAQSTVPTSDAAAFIGDWSIDLEGPQPFTMQVSITDNDGQVAAEVGSMMGGDPTPVDEISKTGDNLVLNYDADFQGQSIPVAITLTPTDGNVRASVDFAGGQFMVSGNGTKE